MDGVPAFEVRCPSCDVSFPLRTRRCIHCGGRTGPGRVGDDSPAVYVAEDEYHDVYAQTAQTEVAELDPLRGREEEPRAKGRGRMNAGISLVWILMAVAFSIMRACGGG